jgi:hypothetical protein
MSILSAIILLEVILAALVVTVLAVRAFGPRKTRDRLERFASHVNPHWM